jgi:hypothetical protein
MKRKQCPACRSLDTTVATGRFAQSSGQAFKNRVCRDCRTAWRPQTPKWLAIALIVLGIAILILQNGIDKTSHELNAAMGKPVVTESHDLAYWIGTALAGSGVGYGIAVLFGKVGDMQILGKVESSFK